MRNVATSSVPGVIRFVSILLALSALAAPAGAAAAERPLVYVIAIDGLDGDSVEQGQTPFISSLLAGTDASATYFPESSSVMPAETNPNHVAMMTGAFADHSGVPANAFALYAPLLNEDTCATTGPFDFGKPPTPTSGEDATCLIAESVFASIKRQGNPDGLLTAAIFGKPKLGRIFANRTVDPAKLDVDHLWAPCDSAPDDDGYCEDVQTNPVTGYAADDSIVMDEVLRVAEEGVGEAKRRPDLVFANLPQVDSAGHAFGRGVIYDAAIGMADTEIQRLVNQLKSRGEWERTVLVLVSDHSMDSTASRVSPGERFGDAGIPESAYVEVPNGSASLIYLSDRTNPDRFALLKKMRDALAGQTGYADVLYREANPEDGGEQHTVGRVRPEWRLSGERVGDLIVTTASGTGFEEGVPLPGGHGAPHTADNFLAMASGGAFVRQSEIEATAFNADLAPTVMGLFGLAPTRDNAARWLGGAFDVSALPGRAAPSARPALRVRARRAGKLCVYRVKVGPKGGVYDVQRRGGKRWRKVRSKTERTTLRHRGAPGQRFRARARSAAGIRGPWRTTGRRCRGR